MKPLHTTTKFWLSLLILLTSACESANTVQVAPSQTPPPLTGGGGEAPPFTVTPSPAPSATDTPIPTFTPTVTLTATPTPHPMSIEAMRQGVYPGSEITIEETFEPGANYSRYRASYLSEGLKIYALLTIPDGEPPSGGWRFPIRDGQQSVDF